MRKHAELRKMKKNLVDQHRWMVSYADFITLLFGFFVTMYALSSVSEGHYRVLAESIASALAKSKTTIQQGTETTKEKLYESGTKKVQTDDVVIKSMTDSVIRAMTPWIEAGLINVKKSPVLLQVEINASALFGSGSANAFPEAKQILRQLADVFKDFPNAVHVEGFTDNKPINTPAFPSNWELSAARAASIVRMFSEIGIDPKRMAAVGYSEYRPVADNNSEIGRTRNRRVVITVLSGNDPRSLVEVVEEIPHPAILQTEFGATQTSRVTQQEISEVLSPNEPIIIEAPTQISEGRTQNTQKNILPETTTNIEVQSTEVEEETLPDFTVDPDLDI